MRRTELLALLLLAVTTATAAGLQAKTAGTHRKAAAGARAGSPSAVSRNNSTTRLKTRSKGGSKAASRMSVRGPGKAKSGSQWKKARRGASGSGAAGSKVSRVRYTRYSPTARAAVPEASSSYSAGYRTSSEAGLAAASRQTEGDGTTPALTGRYAPQVADSALQADAPETFRTPAVTETTETETPETPPIDQVARLRMSGTGRVTTLRGSLASLERQNMRVEADGLERILDEGDLGSRIEHKLLVPLPASAALAVNPNLSETHRYCRPWTARFLADLARAHSATFHKPLQVNSAVRTVEYQRRLMYTNGNAADAEGDIVSPHLTGSTVDIGKQGLSRREIAWMRSQLLGLQQAGRIDVEEEFAQACFHITVYKSYSAAPAEHNATRPGMNNADTRRKAAQPANPKPASQLPADLAVGVFPAQGR